MPQSKQSKQAPDVVGDHTYTGKFSDQQTNGNSFRGRKYGNVESDMTDYQSFLYNRALFGLAVYSQEEIKEMRWDKRKRIIKVHKRAQTVLNIWKQQIVNKLSTHLFAEVFPNTIITETFIATVDETDPEHINRMSFKTLRITEVEIASKLIAEGILPPNFHELKTEQVCK